METQSLRIEPCFIPRLEKLIEGKEAFEKAYGIKIAEHYIDWPEVLPEFLDKLRSGHAPEWHLYLIIHKADNALIGTCGYKGAPDQDGIVEIGYSIAPEYRKKGYATEAAKALIENAFLFNEVKTVCAHTLTEKNASTKVLEKSGMRHKGETFHEKDGRVWRWEIEKKQHRE